MRAFIFLAVSFILASGLTAQEPAEDDLSGASADVFLAKGDGKGNPGEPASDFVTTDTPIYCVVRLADAQPANVKMHLVAVNVAGLRPEMRVVSASFDTVEGQNEVYFNGRPEKVWFVGSYRADIFVNGKPYRSVNFTVRSLQPKKQTVTPTAKSKRTRPKPRIN